MWTLPRRNPPLVESWTDRHGKRRFYFRRGKGARVALPGAPGTAEFEAAYAEALAGNPRPAATSPGLTRGTIAWGIASYLRSADYLDLRETTRRGYLSRLEAIRREHGHRPIAGLTRERIVKGVLGPYVDRPGQRLNVLKILRVLIRHWREIGILTSDPSAGIRRPKGGEVRAWSEEEISAFEARWPIGTRERLAFALMLYTGQRRSDVHRMTWADVSAGAIRVVQQKTGARLTIPLHPALAAILDATPREHVAILTTAHGAAFTVAGFSNWMRDAIVAADLSADVRPHGLRKAAGRRLAEAGCRAHEIMAVLGHTTLSEAERYTRDADQARLARAAFGRLAGQDGNGNPLTRSNGFGDDA